MLPKLKLPWFLLLLVLVLADLVRTMTTWSSAVRPLVISA